MKINRINAIPLVYNTSLTKGQNISEQSTNNSSFEFSSVSSSAIKSNALTSISFKSNKLGSPEAIKKESEIIVEAFNIYAGVMQVFRNTAPDCAKEAKELYEMASDDIQNVSNDKCLTLRQTIYNGEIVPHRLLRADGFGQPIYSADFSKGKISQINAFDMAGNVSKVIKFNQETGALLSYQRNFGDENTEYNFLIEYDSEFTKYFESPTTEANGNKKYAKVIEFKNAERLEYKEDVITTPEGEELQAKRIFDFGNLNTFDYCSYFKKSQGEEPEYGEKISVENNNMISWE